MLTYLTNMTLDEANRVAPITNPSAQRTVAYRGPRGTDFIHFATSDGNVSITILDGPLHLESALRYIEGQLRRYIAIGPAE